MKNFCVLASLFGCFSSLYAQDLDRGMKAQSGATQDVRVALVIGNGAYADSPLRNPPNDAAAMAAELRACGFDVTLLTNAGLQQMETAAQAFGNKIRNNQGVGFFYYAGHGMQVQGENYLIPVGANITVEGDVKYKALNVGQVLAQMEAAQNKLNIVVLDACRNNPYARSFRSAAQGLAQTNAPAGSFVAYATAPGSVAADGTGNNGLYTQELLKAMRTPGLTLEQVFKQVRAGVLQQSNKAQVPWENSSVVGDFYFRVPVGGQPTTGSSTSIQPLASISAPKLSANLIDRKQPGYEELELAEEYLRNALDAKAVAAWERAATIGNTQAIDKLLIYYYWSYFNPKVDSAKAREWALKGNPQKSPWVAQVRCLTAPTKEEMLRMANEFAAAGNAGGQEVLGMAYRDGNGIEADPVMAVRWFRKAAEQGYADAQTDLASMYAGGRGVEKDNALAFQWAAKAAEQGFAAGQNSVGFSYLNGRGVQQDYTLAEYWYRKAAEQGYATSQIMLGNLYFGGKVLTQDYAQAVAWYRKAANKGFVVAQAWMGYFYREGKGVQQDYAQAAAWYRKAADAGYAPAMVDLGILYLDGSGVPKYEGQAVEWFRAAADKGFGLAQYWMGRVFSKGQGVRQDYAEAAAWYRKAADKGYAEAQSELGILYENGLGVEKSYQQAIFWYRKAAKQGHAMSKDWLSRRGIPE